ncbi:uncharacterized protein F26C11.3-like [Saccostrea echinata]|uniref:uncharacterized protein F26C11.3-like n=1 Tax=Saccostrea echinata TaxID=191078 RepID=UPI002A835EA8|nr:uncharacterized protein F26C11.3-like [Saccostrea echinata]
MVWLCIYRNSSSSIFLFTSPQIPQLQSYLGTVQIIGGIFYDNHSTTGNSEVVVYDDNKAIYIDQIMACAKENFLTNIRSYNLTIKHSMSRCSPIASLEYIVENGAPQRFETPASGLCLSAPYRTIQSIFIRCLVVTLLTNDIGFYFQFKTKDIKSTFVAGDAAVITGYWIADQSTQYLTTTETDIATSVRSVSSNSIVSTSGNLTKLDFNTTLNDLMTTMASSNLTEKTLGPGTTGYITADSMTSSDKISTSSEETAVETTAIMTASSQLMLSSFTTATSTSESITAASSTAYQSNTTEYSNSTTTNYNEVDIYSTQTTIEEETILVGSCVCKCTGSGYKWTKEELAERILQRKTESQLIRKNLTAYYRSLTSAIDQRISSQCIGYIGSVILISFLCVLIFCDFQRFWYLLVKSETC